MPKTKKVKGGHVYTTKEGKRVGGVKKSAKAAARPFK